MADILPRFVLGSSSKFRQANLLSAPWISHYRLSFCSPNIDEKAIRAEDPATLVTKITQAKLESVLAILGQADARNASRENATSEDVVLVTDQVAVYKGLIREKPVSTEECCAFLRSYSNDSVDTIACFILCRLRDGAIVCEIQKTTTYFGEIPDSVCQSIVTSGSTLNSSGGFAIEDPQLAPRIRRIDGTVQAVQGLDPQFVFSLIEKLRTQAGT